MRPLNPIRVLLALALSAAIAPLAASCGGTDEAFSCEDEFGEQCGEECFTDGQCGEGLYCGSDATCTADCTQGGNECGLGVECSPNGRCGEDTGGFLPEGEGTGSTCADVHVELERLPPTVIMLIDQSSSMEAGFSGGTRWSVLENVLMDESTGLISTLQDDVRFGLALYSSVNGYEGGTCPMMTEVQTALGNYAQMKAAYASANPIEDTPTGEAIDAVVATLSTVTEPGNKVIVLATDGEPDTCDEPDPQNGQARSIAAAQAAYAAGIETYVISVGADVGIPHLEDMANAGAGLPPGGGQQAPYYQALDQAALIDAFETIIDGVQNCVFTLNGSVIEGAEDQGNVVLDGDSLPYGDPNGWKLNGPSEIELVGAACEAIQDGDHTLDVSFPCDGVDIIETK